MNFCIFSLELSYKNSCIKFDAFSRRNDSFLYSKSRGLEAKVLRGTKMCFFIILYLFFKLLDILLAYSIIPYIELVQNGY